MTYALGLTGSIGMGKSTTAQMFKDMGIPVWDADAVVHKLYETGGAAVEPIGELYPSAIVDGAVSRTELKRLINADMDVLRQVEGIVHPLVATDRERFLAQAKTDIVVFDIPLLFEIGSDKWLDSVLVVSVPANVQAERVLKRPGMTQAQLDMLLSHQMPDADKRARADHVIETLTVDGTRADVAKLVETIRKKLTHA